MALLTAEDVLNKAFSKTKYREGFDQDEVDDFLDEVAHTISSLMAERDDFAARLQAAQSGQPVAPAAQPAGDSLSSGDSAAGLLGAATDPNPSPTGMLAMAQKLHDEYVTSGEAEKERIIAEAKDKAETIVEQAQHDAESRLEDLGKERSELESKIDDLRRFERDYRNRLTTYLENLLGDLDHGAGKNRAPREIPSDSAGDSASQDAGVGAFAAAGDDAGSSPQDSDTSHDTGFSQDGEVSQHGEVSQDSDAGDEAAFAPAGAESDFPQADSAFAPTDSASDRDGGTPSPYSSGSDAQDLSSLFASHTTQGAPPEDDEDEEQDQEKPKQAFPFDAVNPSSEERRPPFGGTAAT